MTAAGREYWIRRGTLTTDRVEGPLASEQVRRLGATGKLLAADFLATSRSGPWVRADSVKGLVLRGSPGGRSVAERVAGSDRPPEPASARPDPDAGTAAPMRAHARKLGAIALAGAAMGAIAHFAWMAVRPPWEASVVLEFRATPGIDRTPADAQGDGAIERLLRTEAEKILLPSPLKAAMSRPELADTAWGRRHQAEADRISELERELRVDVQASTRSLSLSWRSHDRRDVAVVLNGIARTYIAVREAEDRALRSKSQAKLETQLGQVMEEVRTLTADAEEISRIQGIDAQFGPETADDFSRRRDDAVRESTEVQARIESLDRKLRDERFEDEDLRTALMDANVRHIENGLSQVQIMLNSSRERFGVGHPQVQDLAQRERALRERLKVVLEETMLRNLQAERLDYARRADALRARVAELTQGLADVTQRLPALAARRDALAGLRQRIADKEQQRTDLRQLIAELDDAPNGGDGARVRLLREAVEPSESDAPSLGLMAVAGASLATAFVGLPLLARRPIGWVSSGEPAGNRAQRRCAFDEEVHEPRPVLEALERDYYRAAAGLGRGPVFDRTARRLRAELHRLSDDGCAQATFDLAAEVDTGLSGAKDADAAWTGMTRAAAQGHAVARTLLARSIMQERAPSTRVMPVAPGMVGLWDGQDSMASVTEAALRATTSGDLPPGDPVAAVLRLWHLPGEAHLLLHAVVAPRHRATPLVGPLAKSGVLVLAVSESDFHSLAAMRMYGGQGPLLRVERFGEASHGAEVTIKAWQGRGEPSLFTGTIMLEESVIYRVPDRRTKSGYRREPGAVNHVPQYRMALARRQDELVQRVRLLGMTGEGATRLGHFPVASRFDDEDAKRVLGERALGCAYEPTLQGQTECMLAGARNAESSHPLRLFWLVAAAQFVGVRSQTPGFGTPWTLDLQRTVGDCGVEGWTMSKEDEEEAVDLARRWTSRFWPALSFRPLPQEVMSLLEGNRLRMADKGIPIPSSSASLQAARHLTSGPIVGPQPPGVTQLRVPVAIPASMLGPIPEGLREGLVKPIAATVIRLAMGYLLLWMVVGMIASLGMLTLLLGGTVDYLHRGWRDGVVLRS